MSDAYAYWRAALRGISENKATYLPTMYDIAGPDNPQPGMYRMRPAKDAAKIPMQIWLVDKDGNAVHEWRAGLTVVGTIDGHRVDSKILADRWLFCEPVTKTDFEHYKAHKMWPGEIGHNSGDLSLAEEITDFADTSTTWLYKTGITDQTTADQAANRRAKLLELAKQAASEEDARTRPLKEQIEAIKAEWRPLHDTAKKAADDLRDKLTVYMREQDAKRKAIAEAAQKAAAEAAKALPGEDVPLPLLELQPVRAGGQRGRKAGLRTVTKYEVENIALVIAALAANAELHEAAATIARKLMKAGQAIPGMKTVTEQVAA